MTDDKELIERLRDFEKVTVGDARDAADRIEALTEQLAAARQDADEAEAYAWKLEQELWPRIWQLFQRHPSRDQQ